ncbi:MAG: TIGR02186 family protein [Pseudomonadota bacterium]|nr:TIGR02186 family protein [Pseudomonadota bacterium]
MRRQTFALVFAASCALATAPANAAPPGEAINSDISSRDIAIESNFSGARIVIFGNIDRPRDNFFDLGQYNVAVVIRGPEQPVVTRRKDRVFGMWINQDARAFAKVPSFYAVLSSQEVELIARPAVLSAYGIGFDNLSLIPEAVKGEAAPEESARFREALIRLKEAEGLYVSDPKAVTFVGRSLFRATVDLPANVPVGEYATDVYLIRGGEVLSHNRSTLRIHKAGFERLIYTSAYQYPLWYGIAAVIVAVAAGLAASAIFRKS